ncbi:MAG: PQQ-like beta-propeller repeat protein, partial [Planctomycetaceae bacterium]|nr:PQQ-like beta-propeller repeat protein [Planctomycetaceae bacterium]
MPLRSYLLTLLTCSLLTGAPTMADDWPAFLGPQRNGISTETGLIDSFPATGPKELWRIPGGVGMSGCAILGDVGCTLVQDDQQQSLLAFDANTGKTLWKTALCPAYSNAMGDGPRATPALTAETAFAYTGEGRLFAVDLKTGSIQWQQQPVISLKGKPAEYGMAGSPLVVGEQVIVHVGAPEATVASFSTRTGALRWTAGQGHACGYSSPTLLTLHERPILACFSGNALLGLDPNSGKQLWEHEYVTDYNCNIAVPIAVGNDVFISAGE